MKRTTLECLFTAALALLATSTARAGGGPCDDDADCSDDGELPVCLEWYCNTSSPNGPAPEGAQSGYCNTRPVSNPTPCDDGNACTEVDSCSAGSCVGGSAVICSPLDQCHVAGTCDTGTGVCSDPPAAEFTPCSSFGGAPQGARNSVFDCDAPDSCDGSGTCVDRKAIEGTECGDSTDDACDNPDTCDNAGNCANDNVEPASVECRPSADDCDVAENCDGAGNCDPDAFATSSSECRQSAGECDAAENCTGSDAACPADAFAAPGTSCGDPSAGACKSDQCDGSGNCEPSTQPCGLVTGGGTCLFDKNPLKGVCDDGIEEGEHCVVGDPESACVVGGGECVQTREFRLVLTPDVQGWPAHKLNASNPGQFRYNAFATGTPGEIQVVTFSIPFPFVTQGAVPVHLYDGAETGQDGDCFVPPAEALAGFSPIITAQDWIDGQTNASGVTCDSTCGPLDGPLSASSAARCTFDVEYEVPASGEAYLQVHLDYGLKGVFANGNPCEEPAVSDRYDAGTLDETFGGWDALGDIGGEVRIANCQPYDFAHEVDGNEGGSDTVKSQNIFKRIAGVLGLVWKSADGSLVANGTVELVRAGKLVARAATDADGYYLIRFKHKGKAATYTVRYRGETTLTQEVHLKANGWAEVNFDLSTAAASTQLGRGVSK